MNFSWFPSVNDGIWLRGIWIAVSNLDNSNNVTFMQEGVAPSGDVFLNFVQWWWFRTVLVSAPNDTPKVINFVENQSEVAPYRPLGPVLVVHNENVNFTIYRSSLRDGVAVWTFLMDNYTVYRLYTTMTYATQVMVVMEFGNNPNVSQFYIAPLNFSHLLVEYPNGSWMPVNTVPLKYPGRCPSAVGRSSTGATTT